MLLSDYIAAKHARIRPPAESLANIVWTASRADESTISSTGADIVAAAVVAAGWISPTEAATRDAAQRAAGAETALRDGLASLVTHNGTPVTPENLRYAATHQAITGSWIFDVLTGLADALSERGAQC